MTCITSIRQRWTELETCTTPHSTAACKATVLSLQLKVGQRLGDDALVVSEHRTRNRNLGGAERADQVSAKTMAEIEETT